MEQENIEIFEKEGEEQILKDNPERWVVLPIKYHDVWDEFKRLEESFWTPEDVVYGEFTGFPNLTDAAKGKFLKLLVFNAISYRKVYDVEEATMSMLCTVQSPEARSYYSFQIAFETFHIEVYGNILESALNGIFRGKDSATLCQEVWTMPSVRQKSTWYRDNVTNAKPMVQKLLSVALAKHVFQSAELLWRGWLTKMKVSLNSFTAGCELVARDRQYHLNFCSLLYNSLNNKLSPESVSTMTKDAILAEVAFIIDFVPIDEMGLTETDVTNFVDWCVDDVLVRMKIRETSKFRTPPVSFVAASLDTPPEKPKTSIRQSAKAQMELLEMMRGAMAADSSTTKQQLFSLDEDF